METLQYYTAHDDYCFVCLHSSSETSLVPHPANMTEFFAGLVMNILSPWICCNCADVLRTYHELRGRTQRAQALLCTVILHPQDIEANKDYFISELNLIKYNALKPQITKVTTNENDSEQNEESIKNEIDIEYDNTFSEIISNEIDVKPTSAVVGLNGVKFENDSTSNDIQSVACSSINPTQGDENSNTDCPALPPLVKITRIKKPALVPNIISLQKGPVINLKHPQRINSTNRVTPAACTSNNAAQVVKNPNIIYVQVPVLKTTQGLSSKLRKVQACCSDTPPQIKETFTDVTFDENEDMYIRLKKILQKKIISTRITEEEYRTWVSKTLKSHAYTGSDKCKCDFCAVIILRKNHFAQHLKRHNQVTDHPCPLCFQYLETRQMVQNHISQHLKRYVCVECGEMSRKLTTAITHYFTRHTQIKFHCKKCNDLVFEDPMLLKKHIEIWHKKKKNEAGECHICHKKYSNIKTHLREQHKIGGEISDEVNNIVSCTICKRICANDFILKRHIKNIHEKHEPSYKFNCNDCGKGFTRKFEMIKHISIHHLKKNTYKCRECGKMFLRPYHRRRHREKIHCVQISKHVCDICGKDYSSHHVLRIHSFIHTGEKPHVCTQCGRAFRQKAGLTTHTKLVHEGIKYKDIVEQRKKRAKAKVTKGTKKKRALLEKSA